MEHGIADSILRGIAADLTSRETWRDLYNEPFHAPRSETVCKQHDDLRAENERLHVWIVDLRAAVQYLTKENEALRNAVHSEVSAPPFPLGRAIQRFGLPTP